MTGIIGEFRKGEDIAIALDAVPEHAPMTRVTPCL